MTTSYRINAHKMIDASEDINRCRS